MAYEKHIESLGVEKSEETKEEERKQQEEEEPHTLKERLKKEKKSIVTLESDVDRKEEEVSVQEMV